MIPVKNFNLTANLGLFNDNTRYNELGSQYASSSGVDGYAYVTHSRVFGVNSQILADYKIESGLSTYDFLLGYESYTRTAQGLNGYNNHLYDPFIGELGNAHGKSAIQAGSSTNRYMTEGFFGRVQYEFDSKIFVNASYRRDASSRFAKENRWGNFGSIGGAWLISKENFMSGATWVDMLKLKASYGIQGNDNLGGYYPYSDQYGVTYNEETGEYSLNLTYKGNEDLTWESSKSFNAGFEFGLFNGILNGSVEYYSRTTTDLLYSKPVPISAGNPTGEFPLNVGSVRNNGIEVSLDGTIYHSKKVDWSWNLNLTSNKNEILSLDESIEEEGIRGSYYIQKVGGSIHEAYMLKFAGLNEEGKALYYMDQPVYANDDPEHVGKPIRTDIVTTDDPTKATKYDCGAVYPKVFGGFGTSASFYGFDATVQFSYQLGGKYYDGSYQALMHTQKNAGSAMHKDLLNAWSPENTNTDIPRLDGDVLLAQSACDRFLTSSNYLALNNAQIGYTIPAKVAKKMRLGSMRVYVAGENLMLLTARQGLDPRYGTGLGSYTSESGMNSNDYGAMRNVTGGITLTF